MSRSRRPSTRKGSAIMRSFDIHQHITDQILAMLDQPRGDFQLPWHVPGSMMRPLNAVTGNAYQGINILCLWAAAEGAGYASGIWATYRQWASLGAHVRKGGKSSYVVFYKQVGSVSGDDDQAAEGGSTDQSSRTRLIARASAVFAAEQVDGYEPPAAKPVDLVQAIGHAEDFVAATRATIHHEGHRAFYRPSTDDIHLPAPHTFIGSRSSSTTESPPEAASPDVPQAGAFERTRKYGPRARLRACRDYRPWDSQRRVRPFCGIA
jgi:antirestriction protein ArdC